MWATAQIPDLSATYWPLALPVNTQVTDYTVLTTDRVVISNKATAINITLPSAVTIGAGRRFIVKSIGVGTTTVKATAGNIDGVAPATGVPLTQYQKGDFISDGTNWYTI